MSLASIRRVGITLAALSLIAVGSTASASVGASQPGQHTVHTGPMTISTPATPAFKVGSVTQIWDPGCGFGEPYIWTKADVGFKWSAHSTAGAITSYDVWITWAGLPPSKQDTQTSPVLANQLIDNYQGDCGGGSLEQTGWYIVAHDSAGHSVTSANVVTRLNVDRWNNITAEEQQGTWTYTGTWTTSNCLCADGGSQTYTTISGASATYAYANSGGAGTHLALMVAKGPSRGSFQVFLDGALKGTINTHASANLNRVLVWDSGPLTAGAHTIRVVNLATAGQPRIDVNAMTIAG